MAVAGGGGVAQLATMLLEASPTVRPTNDWLPAFGLSADSRAQQANHLDSEYPPDVPRQIDALQSRQQTGSLSSASNSHGGVTSRHDWQHARGQPLSSIEDPESAGWFRAKPEPETAEWFRKQPMTSDIDTEMAGWFRGQPASAAGLQLQRSSSQTAGTLAASTSEHTQTTHAVPSYTQVLPEPPITPEQLSSNPAAMVQQAGDQAVAAWRSLLDDQV